MNNDASFDLQIAKKLRGLEYLSFFKESGRVRKVLGPVIEGTLPGACVGGVCQIIQKNKPTIEAEIVGFRDRTAILMPLRDPEGVSMGARIEQLEDTASVVVGDWMIGKLLDGNGRLPNSNEELFGERKPIRINALSPDERRTIDERLDIGVRALDAAIPFGKGQRLAVMAASGVGKSVLMGMIARKSKAQLNVIALIGERGREVTEFLDRDLGPEGMKNSIVVAVTGDQSPVLKVRGAYVATAIAEYFRDKGMDVLLMMDSVTRFGMALREIGLAAGEPPTTKGYTPSVFAQMPRLLERAGAKKGSGSITGLYTVLVEGNDMDDPIADNVRSIVDGHIVLSRTLAEKNHYPAIDVLASVSRLTHVVATDRDRELASKLRQVLAVYKDAEDLINIGGYRKGNNPEWDKAIELYPKVIQFLRQRTNEGTPLSEMRGALEAIFRG